MSSLVEQSITEGLIPPQGLCQTAEVPTPHDDMLASIGRTAYVSVLIPMVNPGVLETANLRVAAHHTPEATRHLYIVGHDAIKFSGERAQQLPSQRASELLGLFIAERELHPPIHYARRGFAKKATDIATKVKDFRGAFDALSQDITDANGKPLAIRGGPAPDYPLVGISDVVVTDLRHSSAYKTERKKSSIARFSTYILDGGPQPNLLEPITIRGARVAMQETAGKQLTREQEKRFYELSTECAKAISSRTDEYNAAHTFSDILSHERQLIADIFEPRWQDDKLCGPKHSSLFYSSHKEKMHEKLDREAQAKAICRSCPVRSECLTEGLKNIDHGVWGGLNEEERRQYARQMKSKS